MLALVLGVFALFAHGPDLSLEFAGDDYVFLDKTRAAPLVDLWSPATSVAFGWYRPWSRELHFWCLQHLFGAAPSAFRVANVALWVVALCLYAVILTRLASKRVAAIATMGVAALYLWGTPLLWVSGSQDLWMLVLALLSFWLVVDDHPGWAILPFSLALLSKETAGVLPALFSAYLGLVHRRRWGQMLRETWPFWSILMVWAVLHPTLHLRFFGHLRTTAEVQNRPPLALVLIKNVLAGLNLAQVPRPQELDTSVVIRIIATCVLLGGGLYVAVGRDQPSTSRTDRRLWGFAASWALIGWAPSILPSIGWHAYYGCFGALGLWLALALWLRTKRMIAVTVVAVLALLRGALANTLSSDWGDETYFIRAGSTLAAIRADLARQYPTLPAYSRVYFSDIPNRIGLIAGESPALRVWYGDSTLRAGYYSYYRPRALEDPPGRDFFFRFDSSAGMVEVMPGDERLADAFTRNPKWEADHDGLATTFMMAGDLPRAAVELEKVSLLRHRPDAAIYAAACWELSGEQGRADSLMNAARVRLGVSEDGIREIGVKVKRDVLNLRHAPR